MAKGRKLFFNLDTIIFSQIENFKTTQYYQKIADEVSSLDEDVRVIVDWATTITLIALPIIVIGVFLILNQKMKNEFFAPVYSVILLPNTSQKHRHPLLVALLN